MIFLRTLFIAVVLLTAGCDREEHRAGGATAVVLSPENVLIVTSNYPLYFFASRIAASVDDAPGIILPDIHGDPAFWIPSAEQIQLLQSADKVLLNGAGAESWLNLVTIDRRLLIDTSLNIADQLIPLDDSVQHQHGPQGEHSHQGDAFTIWLDPRLAVAQAHAVTDALIEFAPTAEYQFRNNMAKLEQELMALDAQVAEVMAKLEGRPVLFSHPVYQYLQRRHNINGRSLHWEPDQEPGTSAWIALQQTLATHPATIMIWEDLPLQTTNHKLAEAGILSVPFHTAANRPAEGDYLDVMRANVERIAAALQERSYSEK